MPASDIRAGEESLYAEEIPVQTLGSSTLELQDGGFSSAMMTIALGTLA